MPTPSSRAKLLGASLVVLCIVAGIRACMQKRGPPTGRGEEEVDQLKPDRDPGLELDRAGGLRLAQVAPELKGRSSPIRGVVVDDVFEVPLPCAVSTASGAGTMADSETGRFEWAPPDSDWTGISFESVGYHRRELLRTDLVGMDSIEVRLTADSEATLIVEYESGQPVAGVPVIWRAAVDRPERRSIPRWIDGSAQVSGRLAESVTDRAGIARMAIGMGALADVQLGRTQGSRLVWMAPGSVVKLRVPQDALTLQLLDSDTRRPVAGEELEFWYPREILARSQRARSDESGQIPILPTSFPILVRYPEGKLWQRELVPIDGFMTRVGTGGRVRTMLRIDAPSPTGNLVALVNTCGPMLKLVDAESGEPIVGLARVRARNPRRCGPTPVEAVSSCTVYSPRSSFADPDQICRVVDGLLELSCLMFDGASTAGVPPNGINLIVTVEGYSPGAVVLAPSPLSAATPIDVQLRRAKLRRLVLHHADGVPYRGEIAIHALADDVLCLRESTRDDGSCGPFDWSLGDVSVQVAGRWSHRVSAGELERLETVPIVLESITGKITLTGIPVDYPRSRLVAKGSPGPEGKLHAPSSIADGTCTFTGLSPGDYLVGPRAWVEGVELASIIPRETHPDGYESTGMRTQVGPGSTIVVAWRPEWAAGRELEGHVRLVGPGNVQPFLLPLYGGDPEPAGPVSLEPPRITGSRRSPQIHLDPSGRYRIGALDPLPKLIAIAVVDDALWGAVVGLHVLQTIRPGESATVEVGSAALRWTGQPRVELSLVRYSIPAESLNHPVHSFYERADTWWDTRVPLVLHGIPRRLAQLTIDGQGLDLSFSPDGWMNVEYAGPHSAHPPK